MMTQMVIRKNKSGGYDMWARALMPHGEYAQRFRHMVEECGWNAEQAARELYAMQAFIKKNTTDEATLEMCEDAAFTYIDPGDIVDIDGKVFVVNARARA